MLIGDIPGTNVVIKCPNNQKERDLAQDEAHLIELLADHSNCNMYVIKPMEELIVY